MMVFISVFGPNFLEQSVEILCLSGQAMKFQRVSAPEAAG